MSISNREKEIRLIGIDVDKVKKILIKNGATLVQPRRLMKIYYFTHPQGKEDSMVRLRDEGTHKTLTIKTDLKSKFVIEREIKIDSLEEAEVILKFLGCKPKEGTEKFREQWKLGGCKEIVFDTYPGLPTFMEIDCNSMSSLEKTADLLGYSVEDHTKMKPGQMYDMYYGTKMTDAIRKKGGLTFSKSKKLVEPMIKKNKKMYLEIINSDLKKINE